MTVPPESAAALSRREKEELLRKVLVERISRTRTAPTSFAQERLWFLDRMQLPGALYNVPAALRLRGALDAGALERALGEIVRRHESLRTTFAESEGAAVQVIAPFSGFSLPVDDVPGADEAEMRRRAAEEAAWPFDLSAGPLFRARLLRMADDDHVLLLCIHHIVSDGWSLNVLSAELRALYAAFASGRPSPLPEPAMQYADYAQAQREQLRGEVLQAELAWWKARLEGAPAVLDLPTDHARGAAQTYRGGGVPIRLEGALLERLEALARAEGASLYMVLLAAYQVLLGRYTRSDDVVVGSPIAGRARGETEGLIGFFVNTLVLRADLGGDPAFREVLRRVREATLGAYEHQEVPFEKLVAELQPERSLSHSPLFQATFALQTEDGSADEELPGLRMEPVELDSGTIKFDLSLMLTARPGCVSGELAYSADLFVPATIERMAGHLLRVLQHAAADADAPLSRLELLAGAERAQVLEGWNGTARPYPPTPVHALFAEHARRAPDAVALLHGAESITYAALDARAEAVARRLRGLGVAPETPVGLCVERTPDLLAGVLGIWKAGGAYVPLDPTYPAERLEWIIDDARLPVIVKTSTAVLPAHGSSVVRVDRLPAGDGSQPPVDVPVTADNLAYVIYTSGSTGKPKGVLVQHGSLANLLAATRDAFGVREGDVMPALASYAFDIWLFEALLPLTSGGTTRIVARETVLDVPALLDEAADATLLHAVPALMRQVVHAERAAPKLHRLRRAFVGGDLVPVDLLAEMRAVLSAAETTVLYGPTEGTILASANPVPEDGVVDGHPIGRPFGNVRLFVCDEGGRPQPIGIPGELMIGGAGVARGYLGRAAQTAERFVPDPFSATPGARLYRTGDRARWRAEGTLAFLGRTDGQVKIRGFRIEPGEIEAALLAHPGVREAVVIAREDTPGDRRLVAYVVGSGEATSAALRDALKQRLPEYMVPSAFVQLDALPLNANGKLDRKALPAPEGSDGEEGFATSANPVEEVLAGIWCEVLSVKRVGVRENFFELGGHSLLATLVMARVREVFGVTVPLRALFEGPTVAELAERVEALRRADVPALPGVAPVERAGALPLTFAQERLWFIDRLEPGSVMYNVPAATRLHGALDRDAFTRAIAEMVRRHEVLRTTYVEVDGRPSQVVAPFEGYELPFEDLSALPEAEHEREVHRQAQALAREPFNIATGPIFRMRLLRVGATEHVFLVCIHHIATDGWSTGILYRELSAIYGAYRQGQDSPLADPPVQYADYAAWQRAQLAGEAMEKQLAYWRGRLAGAPTLLALPTDRPRPAGQSYRGAMHVFTIPQRLVEAMETLQRAEGVTQYMVLLAAYQVLLGRYAGAEDVVIGSPIAGRTQREVEMVFGFFVNTLVLRTDLGGAPTFRQVLRRVREMTLAAYEHQEAPFERLVEELQPERSLGHNPLFQAFFALHNHSGEELLLDDVRAEPIPWNDTPAPFDISLFAATGDEGGLDARFVYATDLFDEATMARWAEHLQVLLAAAAADPERRIADLPVLPDAERATLLAEWSGRGERYPVDGALHRRFEAQAAARPDAVAATCDGESLTYAQLNARANRLARRLRALGVAPESRVGLCAERSLDLVVGVLAILKAGGAYVPLDPAHPVERLAWMAEDSGIRVLLTQSALRDRLPSGVEIIDLEDVPADELAEDLGVAVHPSNLAYVIYTSGSTGRPKGVGVTHGNVLRLFDCTQSSFAFGEKDVWTLFHSFAFDFSVWEIWGALLFGGRLVVVPWEVSRDTGAFRALLARERVTVLNQTPSAFRALCAADEQVMEPLEALRLVVFGGEALQYEALRGWLDRYGPRRPRLVNMYGITETTVHVTWHTVTGAELRHANAGSGVGVPIPDLRAYVLDPAGNPSPIGVPGELHVGGAGLARGYLGRPSLTAQRFVPDPFSGDEGARLYRSGDLARWKADGTLEYLGRIDQQVKVRGFRIELGEIESVLLAQPGVAAAAVVLYGAGEDATLAAYYVPAGDAPPASALRDALKRQLPDYMVPAAFVPLERIPLTANGKLDRRALPAPDAAGTGPADGYVAPRTPVEEVLAGTWCEVLGAERVGALNNFFELGGHSLLATRVVSRVRELFSVELPLRAIFESPSLAELAERVEALRRAELPVLPPVRPVARTGPAPLSFAQERLWFLDRMQPGSAAYNSSAALRLRGALHREALERALGEIVHRHEVLRTTFAEMDGAPVQVITPFGGFDLAIEDLSGEADPRGAMRARVSEEGARPFDLAAGPLFRARLLRLADDDHVLLLGIHHVVTDGWSTGVLFRELSALYAAYRDGAESPLPAPAVQYADYAAWQRQHLRGDVLQAQLGWWKERLAGAPALLQLPTDHPRPAVRTDRGAFERIELSAELAERLRALARREGATLYMVVLGAFQVLLGRYAGSDDIVVGSPIAGRTRGELEGLIGFFVNTLVLRTDLGGDPSFREVLRRVRQGTLGAYEHQDAPFEKLVEALQPERSLDHTPLFQVMFTLAGAGSRPALPGLVVEPVEAELSATKFDLDLGLAEDDGALRGFLDYNADLFEPATIQRMAAHLERVLEQVTADADLPLSRLDLLGEGERREVLEAWNVTAREYPAAPVHALFAEHARRAPDAAAVLHGAESITYAGLDARAEAVARRLKALGVGPETPVGLCVERTPELLAGVLGIWKAGGAYVPLDPTYPAERLGWIVEDARLPVILTSGGAADSLPAHGAAIVRIEDVAVDGSHPPVGVAVEASHLAYVIYTSGSTGRPKGVLVQHGSLANLLASTRDAFGVREGDVMPALASYAFDIWLFEALLPLTSGATTRIVSREKVLDVPAMLDEAADATLLHAVPALFRQVIQVERESRRLHRLRRAFVGGDRVPAELLGEMADALSGAEIHVLYGPTEGTILASASPVPADGVVEGHPIGRPLGNVRLYVCDAHGRALPAGVPGELMIGGAGVARGYLGRAAQTAERFVPDPFGAPGARLYRTGDRVRWKCVSAEVRECGSEQPVQEATTALTHSRTAALEFMGRTDAQVKVRGYRIEPGEIEAALRAIDGVRDCVVIAREDAPGETRLAAYFVGEVDNDGLRSILGRTLPEFMVPAAFVRMDRIPLTPNGKLDRAALPVPEASAGTPSSLPRNEVEERVAEVWKEVLGIEQVRVRDNFFDLGGSSLLLYRVFSRLRDLRADLRVVDLFRYSTVEELAGYLSAGSAGDEGEMAQSRSRGEERRNARRRVRG